VNEYTIESILLKFLLVVPSFPPGDISLLEVHCLTRNEEANDEAEES